MQVKYHLLFIDFAILITCLTVGWNIGEMDLLWQDQTGHGG
jgi:hypothetical protein